MTHLSRLLKISTETGSNPELRTKPLLLREVEKRAPKSQFQEQGLSPPEYGPALEYWSIGVSEYWKKQLPEFKLHSLFHNSGTPVLQNSSLKDSESPL
jgi:hypothetical protein